MTYDSSQYQREKNALERHGEEEDSDQSKRLASYADKAMAAFRSAAGETLFPSDLIRCLMHWCSHNGYDVPSSVNGAKFDYAGGFSALAGERSGLVILGVWDEDVMEHPRTAIDQYEAQKLADFLNGWIREQRKPMRPSFCERVAAVFHRRTGSHDAA